MEVADGSSIIIGEPRHAKTHRRMSNPLPTYNKSTADDKDNAQAKQQKICMNESIIIE